MPIRYIKTTDALRVISEFYNLRTDDEKYRLSFAISLVPSADVVEQERYDILLEHANVLAEEMRKYQNADVPERNVGKWVEVRQAYDLWAYECSECGFVIKYESTEEYNYCPHCGAKMDGKEK